ncbi:MAG: dienelactone hydrolase family protein [Solirubrobacteraceae bacterium]|nr:dienelactone hydrolase family protein [Solirubrobacteraceae bacterium]
MVFSDRRDAGLRLAERLRHYAGEDPVVVALPRGGVPVAVQVADVLAAPMDILAVRKLGAPGHPELAVGAVAEDSVGVIDTRMVRVTSLSERDLDETLDRESVELDRRVHTYRGDRPRIELADRTVIIVDDGLATGLTDLAAVRAVRARGARRVVVAAPVGSRAAVELLGSEADDVVCAFIPRDLHSVGQWSADFSEVDDEEVLAVLEDRPVPRRDLAAVPDVPGLEVRQAVTFEVPGGLLEGDLAVPEGARGLVVFAHGSGSGRHSPRNRAVAEALQQRGLATLLFDLLTDEESMDRSHVFDIPMLAGRLTQVGRWSREHPATAELPLGLFGASTGAAAALVAAAELGPDVRAVVSRGGRPDLAADRLDQVTAPTLLIVGRRDESVLLLNRMAAIRLAGPHELAVIDGAGHVFEEPGALEQVAALAGGWFLAHMGVGSMADAGTVS